MRKISILAACLASALLCNFTAPLPALADDIPPAPQSAAPLSALARMPVKEVTIFKDGNAFLMHEGTMPVDANGDVVMDYLPAPIMGTFWPYSADKAAKISAVTAGQRRVLVDSTALSLPELLEANTGAEVVVEELPAGDANVGDKYPATLMGVPTRTSAELDKNAPPNTAELLPQKGGIILLKTDAGTKAVSMDNIRNITFKGDHKALVGNEEFRLLLRLKLDWAGQKPAAQANVGMIYLQKGIRWIPEYKVTIDGKGTATIKLQATLINDMVDLDDVTANLVVGVPSFAMANKVDPIAVQDSLARLSPYFQAQGSAMDGRLSNAMMTQFANSTSNGNGAAEMAPGPAAEIPNPEIGPAQRSEDLFVYTVHHISLKRGQRMVVPVAEFTQAYTDIYTLEIPATPPVELWQLVGRQRQGNGEQSALLEKPRVMHKIRMTDDSKYPLTTAPALILRGDTVLAQGQMTYTPVGGKIDLAITSTVDIPVKKTEAETKRIPDAETWEHNSFGKILLSGQLDITNRKDQPVEIEVTRYVVGAADNADNGGNISMVNVLEDTDAASSIELPGGWGGWPGWWEHFNGIGKITWDVKLDPGKSISLKYDWHYFWQ